jgi:hypothetical protein
MHDLGLKTLNSEPLRILFLTDDREDYLADGILHGLKQISSLQVTDYPKKNCLYESALSHEPFAVRGGGFSLYGLLQNVSDDFDRAHIQQKLEKEWFDLIVISNIWRQWGLLVQWERLLNSDCKLAILDGDDDERFYPSSTTRIRDFGPTRWLDKLINRDDTVYFKREWSNRTNPWPYRCVIKQVSFSIPAEKIRNNPLKKTRLFPNHIVDQEVSNLVEGQTHYAFTSEDAYRQNLAESRFGITTKRGGWECLRHYEIAANGAIPCFRNLTEKPIRCAPHGLKDGVNCISYRNAQELLAQINQLTHQDELRMQQAALSWARSSSTQARAHELLNAMNIAL